MSEKVSKCDWFRHLHVQVALWEEKGVQNRSSSTGGCTCKKSCIDDIKHCLTKRLNLCKSDKLYPKEYEGEVDAFFEILKHETFNSKLITKLVQRRKCLVFLMDFLESFDSLCNLERQQVITRFETHNIKSLVESVQTLIDVLRSTSNIHSQVSSESYIKAETTFNDTTWLRHMYRLCLMISNKVEGRVEWVKVHHGVDPNNAHTNRVTGAKQEFTRRKTLISDLRSLVPRCLQPFRFPRPYREEVQLLLAFLRGGDLDKKKIQEEQKLRKIAIGLNDVLLTVLKIGNDLNEIIKNFESSRRSQLVTCLTDLRHRLGVLSQKTDELQAFSEDKQTSNQSNHDCETDRRKEPSADAIRDADEENTADPVPVKMMNVSNPKATSNGSKEEMIDFHKNGEPSCSHEKTCDLTITDDRDSEYHLSDTMTIQHCPDSDLISDAIGKPPLSPCYGDQLSADMPDTVLNPNSEEYSHWTGSKHSFTTDTCTHETSYAVSDMTLCETMANVSNSTPTTEVDISNEYAVLGVFYGLGSDLINMWGETQLRKFDEVMRWLHMLRTKRSHQTTVQSEGSGDIGIPVMQAPGGSDDDIGNGSAFNNSRSYSRDAVSSVCYSSGSSTSETGEPNGSCSQSSLVDPLPGNSKEHLLNTTRRTRKRRAVDD